MREDSAAIGRFPHPGRSIRRQAVRGLRRAGHRLMCLVPKYRHRAERKAAKPAPIAPATRPAAIPAAAVAAAAPATARRVALDDHEAVIRLLEAIKTRRLHATAGKIQLVHLENIRRKFGARWQSISARAMDLAERVMREALDEGDIFTRYEDFAFVVVFAMIDDAVARRRAEAISGRIHDLLMSDPELAEAFDVKSVTAPVDALLLDGEAASPAALGEGLDAAAPGPITAPIRGASKLLGALSIGYQPFFSVLGRSIGIYVALPERTTEDGVSRLGESAYPEAFNCLRTEEIDRLLTDRVIADLQMPANAGARRIVGTVISYHSLTKSAKLMYRLGQLPQAVRPRFAVEVVGLPDECSVEALARAVRKLANVSGHVAVRVGLFDDDLERFSGCGLRSIGCDLSHREVAALSPGERDPAIRAFVARAKAAAPRAHVYGISTTGMLKTAVAAGADYLSGDAIEPCGDKPRPVRGAEF